MNNCLNCKFAEWSMTKHKPPRIRMEYGGTCTKEPPTNKTAACFQIKEWTRWGLDPQRPYTKCPTFQPKEAP